MRGRKISHRFRAIVISAVTAFGATSVHASDTCAPYLALPSIVQTQAYDPFALNATIDDIDILYHSVACDRETTLTANIGWSIDPPNLINNGHSLAFSFLLAGSNLTSGQTRLGEVNLPLNGVSFTLPTGASGALSQQARIIMHEGQIVPPGFYRLDVPDSAPGNSGLLSQVQGSEEVRASPISIVTEVLSVLKLGVTGCDLATDGAGASFGDLATSCKLNLGDPVLGLINGASRRARLSALANVNFKIAMTSRNGGLLRLSGQDTGHRETEQIHYSASLEGQGQNSVFECAGSDCGTSDLITPSASPLGTDLFFQVRVNDPDITQKRAGRYSDVITLIIQPGS